MGEENMRDKTKQQLNLTPTPTQNSGRFYIAISDLISKI